MGFFRRIKTFFVDIVSEFKRVTWPTREDTLRSTGVVVVLTITISIFLGMVDLGLSELVQYVIR